MLNLILEICGHPFEFKDFDECRNFFKELINTLRQMNYTEFQSPKFHEFEQQLRNHLA